MKSDVQVLIACMNQSEDDLLKKMNIQSDAIVGNQCNTYEYKCFNYLDKTIQWISCNEKGVGLNRNNTLMRASAKYCLFADDDMIYQDNYEKIVVDAFNEIPKADVIIFNLIESNPKRYIIKKRRKVNYFNYLRYGTARIAIKLDSIRNNQIYFNQCFGGGTEHCHGEDNIFLSDCLKKGLKIYAIPTYIARLTEERESTWENVSIEKYIKDQSVLFYTISHKFWKLLILQDIFRHYNFYKKYGNHLFLYKFMIKCVNEFKIYGK